MILTDRFDLKIMTCSDTATKCGYREQFTPPDNVIINLKELFNNVLQPLFDALPGQLSVTSAYRCPRVNNITGGKDTSQHLYGYAADVEYRENGVEMNGKIIDMIKELHLEFDQCIRENGEKGWVHISYREGKNRKQFLTLTK